MSTVPLHTFVRPNGSRDDCGTVGEAMHQLADWLQNCYPAHVINVSDTDRAPTSHDWSAALTALPRDGALLEEPFRTAIDRISELAKATPAVGQPTLLGELPSGT